MPLPSILSRCRRSQPYPLPFLPFPIARERERIRRSLYNRDYFSSVGSVAPCASYIHVVVLLLLTFLVIHSASARAPPSTRLSRSALNLCSHLIVIVIVRSEANVFFILIRFIRFRQVSIDRPLKIDCNQLTAVSAHSFNKQQNKTNIPPHSPPH